METPNNLYVDRLYESPSLNHRFSLTNVSWLPDARKDTIEKNVPMHFLVWKGLSTHDVGVSRDTLFQEIRPGARFETGDFFEETFRGLP